MMNRHTKRDNAVIRQSPDWILVGFTRQERTQRTRQSPRKRDRLKTGRRETRDHTASVLQSD